MKLHIPNCPECGAPAAGSLETVQGLAEFGPIDAEGCCDYGGYTQIYWDSQKSVTGDDGQLVLICPQGHEWRSQADAADHELATPAEQKAEERRRDEKRGLFGEHQDPAN